MSISFPVSLDTLSNPTGSDLLENATAALDHDVQHSNANDAIEALEAKVGANSSAVTTSHDYKLSGVIGSDKAVSKTGTETLTNKTLTAPQINFGSDATGDLIYRNGSGVTSRLAIGSTDQILAVQSGVPAWIANPSATNASYSVKGIVQGLTDEATSGLTIASGVISVNTGTTANKIVKLNASAQLPAIDGSLLTNLPESVAVKYLIGAGTITDKTYWNYQLFFANWSTETSATTTSVGYYATRTIAAAGNFSGSSILNGSLSSYDTTGNKKLIVEFFLRVNSTGTNTVSFGLGAQNAAFNEAYNTASYRTAMFTIHTDGTLYTKTANSSTTTNTSISGVTLTNLNRYRIEVNPGVDIRYYVNGTLRATDTTNLPSGALQLLGLGGTGNTTNFVNAISLPNVSVEL